MIEEFKEQVNKQHAPEELINSTIDKLHEPSKSRAMPVVIASVGTVLLALIIILVAVRPYKVMNYNSITDASLKDIPQSEMIETEYRSVGELTIMIRSSDTEAVAPESLVLGKKTDIQNYEVYLGINEVSDAYLAAFNKDGKNYYIFAKNGDREEFESFIMDFLK